jgi:hypothetical protein
MIDPTAPPCPFCGNPPGFVPSRDGKLIRLYHRCGVVGFIEIGWYLTKQELLDLWSTRAPTEIDNVGIYTYVNDTNNIK